MGLFRWQERSELFPVPCHAVSGNRRVRVRALEDDEFSTSSSLTEHMVLGVALRIESKRSGGVTVFSRDTAPRDAAAEHLCGALIF